MSWPSRFGTLGDKVGMNDWTDDSRRTSRFINDELPPATHPGTKEVITSKRKWAEANRLTGYSENNGEVRSHRPNDKEIERDIDQAFYHATKAVERGETKFSEEKRQMFKKNDEILSNALGFDVNRIFRSE